MPVSQTSNNVQAAIKIQSGIGVAAAGSGSTGLRVKPGQSLKLSKQVIASEEVRRDGQSTRGRHGSRSASAGYTHELSVGTFDDLMQAALRGTWTAAATIAAATLTSITTTTSTIVAASGSWIAQGLRIGDMIKLTGSHSSANNGKWIRVVGVTASTITTPTGALTLDATTDTAASITIAKTVINGATPTERYYTVEEYFQDIDASILGTDMKITKIDFSAQPNKNIEVSFGLMGLDAQPLTGASAPNFTTPTYTTTLPLVMVDGTIRINGVDYSVLTGFSFSYDLGGQVTPTLSLNSPDVFLSDAKLSGSFSAIRQDLAFFAAFSAETQVDFFIHCAENETDPKDFISFYIGNATLSDDTTGIAANGPMTETVPWASGKDEAGGARAATMLKISTSAA